jgi:glucuronokinase
MNENFDCRSKIVDISENNQNLIDGARGCGASAKFTGSGGSIIGIYQDDTMLKKLVIELTKINARVIRPFIV